MIIKWNEVTWYSKILAAVLFVVVLGIGFYLGAQYQSIDTQQVASTTAPVETKKQVPLVTKETQTPTKKIVTKVDIDEFFARDSEHVYMRVFENNIRTYPTSTAGYKIVNSADPGTFTFVSRNNEQSLKGEGEKVAFMYKDKNNTYTFINEEIMGDIVIRSIEVTN